MTKRIIYQTEQGGVAIIIPSGELPLEEVARKDVPAGVRYAIVDTDTIPNDRTFRSAWEVEHGNLNDGHGIGQQAWFIEQYTSEIATINAEQMPARLPDNQQTVEEYDAVVAQWEASKAARITQLNTQIATQQAEMQA
jgi:hypothetical protein